MTTNSVPQKPRLALLFALICLLVSFSANAQTPAAAKVTLTKQERADALKYLEDTRKKFLASVKGLSEEQWKFKSAPDRWSVAEVAEHIALSEDMLFGVATVQAMKSPATPEKKEASKAKDATLLKMVTNRSTKAQAPEQLKPKNKWATQSELVKAFNASRDKTKNFVKTTQEDMRAHFLPHPLLKELDAYQWLLLLASHSERHTLQILEVKADPNFPKK